MPSSVFYQDDRVTLYCGDCRDILPSLAPVDLILTDPPYGIGYATSWRSHGDPLKVPIANDETLDVVSEAWPMISQILSTDRHWYAFASPRNLVQASSIFDFKQILAWDKGDRGSTGDLTAGFGECWEAILYGMKGRRSLVGPRPRSMIRYDWFSTRDPVHPTVKPVPLLRKLIEWSSSPGELVLDPFAGSGTTLRAAIDCGRRAIGIELDPVYCARAVDRLRQRVLFA